jgi:hypothetical protein
MSLFGINELQATFALRWIACAIALVFMHGIEVSRND